MRRSPSFQNRSIYHIYNRSIAKYQIFRSEENCQRMMDLIHYYQFTGQAAPFSDFIRLGTFGRLRIGDALRDAVRTARRRQKWVRSVRLIAWCLMPNHYHFVIQQLQDNGIDACLRRTLDGFTRYINLKRNRRGPLWESRMQSVKIQDRTHLETEINYAHNNPVKKRYIHVAEEWPYSSAKNFNRKLIQTIKFK